MYETYVCQQLIFPRGISTCGAIFFLTLCCDRKSCILYSGIESNHASCCIAVCKCNSNAKQEKRCLLCARAPQIWSIHKCIIIIIIVLFTHGLVGAGSVASRSSSFWCFIANFFCISDICFMRLRRWDSAIFWRLLCSGSTPSVLSGELAELSTDTTRWMVPPASTVAERKCCSEQNTANDVPLATIIIPNKPGQYNHPNSSMYQTNKVLFIVEFCTTRQQDKSL